MVIDSISDQTVRDSIIARRIKDIGRLARKKYGQRYPAPGYVKQDILKLSKGVFRFFKQLEFFRKKIKALA